ncbi:hypothetical protein HNY73_008714 [Argiope bruennichi]|uniref:Uncharacterized protein n=1 Tax=Argiope bruennichi TaxID=94029 RepID=A0A8T0F7A8_ARGBR|nr:hypothetical protein HNY73_008714 [Argiope bruennichi]
MDNPLYAMLFAEELIAYILQKFNIVWNRTDGLRGLREFIPRNRFKSEIGEAVYCIIMKNEEICKQNFLTLLQEGLMTHEKFRYESSLTMVQIFQNGFHPETYLNMCAALAAHTWLSFEELTEDAAHDIGSVSAQVLAFIINFYIYKAEFDPSTDWFLLAVRAQKHFTDQMDNPLRALLFAEDLIEYVLKKFGIVWMEDKIGIRRLREHIPKPPFNPEVGESVYSLVIYYQDAIRDNYEKLMEKDVTNVHDFRYECAITIIFYFSASGYDNVKFLKMCASLTGLAWQYFEKNEEPLARLISLASSEILAYLINFYTFKQAFKPDDLWFNLRYVGRTLMRKIKLKVELPDTDEKISLVFSRFEPQTRSFAS